MRSGGPTEPMDGTLSEIGDGSVFESLDIIREIQIVGYRVCTVARASQDFRNMHRDGREE